MANLMLAVHPSCRWFMQTTASNWNLNPLPRAAPDISTQVTFEQMTFILEERYDFILAERLSVERQPALDFDFFAATSCAFFLGFTALVFFQLSPASSIRS